MRNRTGALICLLATTLFTACEQKTAETVNVSTGNALDALYTGIEFDMPKVAIPSFADKELELHLKFFHPNPKPSQPSSLFHVGDLVDLTKLVMDAMEKFEQ